MEVTYDDMKQKGYVFEKRFESGFDEHNPYTLFRKGNARWVRVYDKGKLTENGRSIDADEL
jgi:hypothetical protein